MVQMESGLAVHEPKGQQLATFESQRDLIKRTLLKPRNREATNDELELFMYTARSTGKDPLKRQIYAQFRWNSRAEREEMVVLTSIDGYRADAERSGKYAGQVGPFWCDESGTWKDAWLSSKPPVAAKVGVMRHDFKEPLWAVALYDEYAQRDRNGQVVSMWRDMPANQLAKCAEALAIRKAFPDAVGGVYTDIEMDQADNPRGGQVVDAQVRVVEDPKPGQPKPMNSEQLRKKLSEAVVKWSGFTEKNERTNAMMSVFDAVGVPRPKKVGDTSDQDIQRLIAWVEDRVEKGVDFLAAVAKKPDADPQVKTAEKSGKLDGEAPARKSWPKHAKPGPGHVHYWLLKLIENAEAWKKTAKVKEHLNTSAREMVDVWERQEKLPEAGSMPEDKAALKYKAAAESKIDWSQYLIPF